MASKPATPPPAFAKNILRGLPVRPPYPPMEAEQVPAIPDEAGWQYEPKWDGFRCLAFRDGAEMVLQSKSGRPLGRYFPDILAALEKLPLKKFVLDGELVIPLEDRLSFEELQMRLHPAASRVKKLSEAHPAELVLFDLLVDEKGRDWTARPLAERRAALEKLFPAFGPAPRFRLSPATRDRKQAQRWLSRAGGDLDGIIAKRLDLPYQSGNREGMVKIKNLRTVDCVVGGFRYGEKSDLVGSLLLGLYDDAGLLHHVGFTSAFSDDDKPALTRRLKKLIQPPGFTGNAPGGPSRWSTRRTAEWEPLAPELVVEVTYDHVSGGRFRHGTDLVRWRLDKAPAQCFLAQILQPRPRQLSLLRSSGANPKPDS
jgi:ATP-dependent DNA ligase